MMLSERPGRQERWVRAHFDEAPDHLDHPQEAAADGCRPCRIALAYGEEYLADWKHGGRVEERDGAYVQKVSWRILELLRAKLARGQPTIYPSEVDLPDVAGSHGSAIAGLKARGLIERTGETRTSRREGCNAAEEREWRLV